MIEECASYLDKLSELLSYYFERDEFLVQAILLNNPYKFITHTHFINWKGVCTNLGGTDIFKSFQSYDQLQNHWKIGICNLQMMLRLNLSQASYLIEWP